MKKETILKLINELKNSEKGNSFVDDIFTCGLCLGMYEIDDLAEIEELDEKVQNILFKNMETDCLCNSCFEELYTK